MANRRGRLIILLAAIAAITLALFIGCGRHATGPLQALNPGGGQAPVAGDDSAQRDDGGLPGVWELDQLCGGAKSVRNGSQVVIAGADYSEADSTTGRDESIEVEETSLNLRAYEPGDFTYAVFGQLVGDGVMGGGRDDDIPLLSLFQTEPCDYGGGRDEDIPLFFYIGIADYTVGSWRWFGPFSDADPEVSLNNDELQDRFKSPSDMLYIAVLAAAGGKEVSQLPLEGLVAALPFQPAERMASQLEDPVGVRVKAIVTNADSGIGTLPQAVTGLSAVVGGSSITVSWEENPDPDVTLHQVFRQDLTAGGPVESLGDVPMPTLEYEDMTAVADTTYRYSVRAVNDTGAGGLGGIEAGPPIIKAVAPLAGTQGDTVTFAVTLDGSQPFTYAWDFGGGATPDTSTEARPAVTLGTINTYSATLIVTNAFGDDTCPFTLTVVPIPNRPPNTPSNPNPPDGATDVPVTLNLISWTGGDPDGDIVYYDVYGGTSNPPPLQLSNLTSTSFNPDGCPYSATVYWKIVSKDEHGATSNGPVWSFTTQTSEWQYATPDNAGNVGEYTSLAAVNGNPAISYYDATNGDLKYVRASDASGTTWGTPVTLDSAGSVGLTNSLAVVNGNPAISYHYDSEGNNELKYVRATDASGTTWGTPVTVDIDSYGEGVGWDTSLEVVNGNPAISYGVSCTPGYLKYVRATDADGTTWDTPVTVDNKGETGGCTSLAIVNGYPAISYYYGIDEDLKYVRATDANGSSWGTPLTLDSAGFVGVRTSLVVINGNPAISYGDATNGNLKYVRATDAGGSSWGTPLTLDSAGLDASFFTSLAIVNGYPAISYLGNGLMYVRASDASGTTWDMPVTVDNSGWVGGFSSLAVINGNPAISYYDTTNGDLKYAYFAP